MSDRTLTLLERTFIERVNQAVEADDDALVGQLVAEFDAERAHLEVA